MSLIPFTKGLTGEDTGSHNQGILQSGWWAVTVKISEVMQKRQDLLVLAMAAQWAELGHSHYQS